jgi:hypothetical protein
VGSTIGFLIGERYGYPLLLRYGSYIGLTETRIKIAQYLFRRRGTEVVLVARFVAVLRSVIGFIAGASRMPFANFMIANSAGAMAWALFYGLGAYYLGKGVEEFARPFAMRLRPSGTFPGRCSRNRRVKQIDNPVENLMRTGFPLPDAVDEMLFPARLTTRRTKVRNQLCDHAGRRLLS